MGCATQFQAPPIDTSKQPESTTLKQSLEPQIQTQSITQPEISADFTEFLSLIIPDDVEVSSPADVSSLIFKRMGVKENESLDVKHQVELLNILKINVNTQTLTEPISINELEEIINNIFEFGL
ncbi:Hypothetical_protein [Hexamita inflata]|uniref:Hypothetical_protein n=1 Tax=Hexamita inflata TaxID=28002 RepID=A0AA86PFT2_9EUKA|nr:Hypothetical protein HINF_LOCUS22840 [Hexamita inflata]